MDLPSTGPAAENGVSSCPAWDHLIISPCMFLCLINVFLCLINVFLLAGMMKPLNSWALKSVFSESAAWKTGKTESYWIKLQDASSQGAVSFLSPVLSFGSWSRAVPVQFPGRGLAAVEYMTGSGWHFLIHLGLFFPLLSHHYSYLGSFLLHHYHSIF